MKNGDQNQIRSFASKVITQNVTILQKCMGNLKRRKEIEDVHDLRVASRRVRVALEIFRHFLPVKKCKNWEQEISSLTKTFGNARDLDIQLEFIHTYFQKYNEIIYKPGGRRLNLRLQQRRARLQHSLQEKLVEINKNGTLRTIQSELTNPTAEGEIEILPPSPLFELSFNVLNKRLDEFLFYEIYLPFPDRIKELHLMRIAAKRLRYSLEIFTQLYPDHLEKTLEVMRSVQTGLGEIRDCDVWLDYLPRFLEKEKKRVTSYFGNSRPFQRLVPGIQFLIENRKGERDRLYAIFITNWKNWRQTEIWSSLRQTIFNPILGNPPIQTLNNQVGENKQ
jgi:CHAD domain-containing protein